MSVLRVAEHFEVSDTGRARRSNEDSYLSRSPLFVVADGMGGAQAGEVASQTAVQAFAAGVPDDGGSPEQRLATVVERANEEIHALSREDAGRAGMGTTLTAVLVGEREVTIAHVGDSRAYRLRDGRLERLTDDHSLVEELMRQGKLTAQEAGEHPQRSIITRALGPEPEVEVDTYTARARDGDVYLLCSDGLTSMIEEDEVHAVLAEHSGLEDAGRALVAAANAAGGRDNITVLLLRVEEVELAGSASPPTDELTSAGGTGGLRADAVRAAVLEHGGRTGDQAAASSSPRRRTPRSAPPTAGPPRRRGRARRLVVPVTVTLVVLGVLLGGAWIASRAVYFVGSGDRGYVAVFQGLPYELPGGLALYQTSYTSGVRADQLPRSRRDGLLDQRLRTRADANDLVRQIELGRISGS